MIASALRIVEMLKNAIFWNVVLASVLMLQVGFVKVMCELFI
jgi:hypothetical protein